jgi:hypothetical protein
MRQAIVRAGIQTMIRARTTVQPGGRVIITHPALQSGETVEVLILLPVKSEESRQSILDILNSVEGHRLFKTAKEVEQDIREERDSWDDD